MVNADNPKASNWTLETLRVYIIAVIEEKVRTLDAKIEEQKDSMRIALASQKELVSQAMASADRAVSKAETASERRFEGVNEFRNTLADQQRTLMPRSEVDVIIKAMEAKQDLLQQMLIKLQGHKSGTIEGWGWAVGAVGIAAAVVAIVFAFTK